MFIFAVLAVLLVLLAVLRRVVGLQGVMVSGGVSLVVREVRKAVLIVRTIERIRACVTLVVGYILGRAIEMNLPRQVVLFP